MPRFMVMVKASKNSEAGVMPKAELFEQMMKFNEELIKAGILEDGAGLQASSKGKRVRVGADGRTRHVIDGPFAETKELVAGFWMWNCKSMDEALEWAKRCPAPMPGEESDIEIRQLMGPEDFGDALPAEIKDVEKGLRELVSQKK